MPIGGCASLRSRFANAPEEKDMAPSKEAVINFDRVMLIDLYLHTITRNETKQVGGADH